MASQVFKYSKECPISDIAILSEALKELHNSTVHSHSIQTETHTRWHYPDLAPGYQEEYKIKTATIIFTPSEKYLNVQERLRIAKVYEILRFKLRLKIEQDKRELNELLEEQKVQEQRRMAKEKRKEIWKKIGFYFSKLFN